LIENKLEFSIHAPYADTNLSADDRSIREAIINRIKKSIDYAKELNAKTLVFHPGWRTPIDGFIPNHSWSLNLKSIRKLTRYAQDLDVIALVENLPDPRDFLLKSQDEFNNFFDETDFDVSMVLDIGHANIRGEIFDFIENFAEKIKHIHVSDNYGEKDQHLKIGDGNINWDKVISKLKECGFDGWIVIESYNGVKESIDYLRKRC
jgi:sugar phosphate isomerase/epimerase